MSPMSKIVHDQDVLLFPFYISVQNFSHREAIIKSYSINFQLKKQRNQGNYF